jgi:hypothetical protein
MNLAAPMFKWVVSVAFEPSPDGMSRVVQYYVEASSEFNAKLRVVGWLNQLVPHPGRIIDCWAR